MQRVFLLCKQISKKTKKQLIKIKNWFAFEKKREFRLNWCWELKLREKLTSTSCNCSWLSCCWLRLLIILLFVLWKTRGCIFLLRLLILLWLLLLLITMILVSLIVVSCIPIISATITTIIITIVSIISTWITIVIVVSIISWTTTIIPARQISNPLIFF